MKSRSSNKFITILTVLAALLCVTAAGNWNAPAFAEDNKGVDAKIELDVYYDDILLHQFTLEELKAIAAQEGNKTYEFSRFNTNVRPSFDLAKDVKGPTVRGILNAALAGHDGTSIDNIAEDQTIELRSIGETAWKEAYPDRAYNVYKAVFTREQLFKDRYCYEHGIEEQGHSWQPAQSGSYRDAKLVPAVISTEESEAGKAGRFLYGQTVPNEQNAPDCVQGMIKTRHRGEIRINSATAEQWKALENTDHGTGGTACIGDEITFDRDINAFAKNGGSRYCIYYTTDGSEPTIASNIYNYNNNGFGDSDEGINKPKIADLAEMTIKAKVMGNGRLDSEVTEFRFTGKYPVDVKITGTTEKATYDGQIHSAEGFTWTGEPAGIAGVSLIDPEAATVRETDAGVYSMGLKKEKFLLAVNNEDYQLRNVEIKDGELTILPAPLTVTTHSGKKVYDGKALTADGVIEGLIEGESATITSTGKQVDVGSSLNTYSMAWNENTKAGNYSITEKLGMLTVTAPPVAKPVIAKLSVKGRSITLKWKKAPGAAGYEIWRATNKKGKYAKVKTIKSGKTVTFKNTGLKKKKTYYFKMRAFKRVGGKTFYSTFSAVKYKKVK